jgi:hypothetical protein
LTIPKKDADKMVRLAQEGKTIADMWRDDFERRYAYEDIYWAVRGQGQASALGLQRSISNRLKKLARCSQTERDAIIEEVGELGRHIYDNLRTNQKKLESIRRALGE